MKQMTAEEIVRHEKAIDEEIRRYLQEHAGDEYSDSQAIPADVV